MKRRGEVEKDQRMIKSRRVFERCGHRQKRKREKRCFFSNARNRALSVCVHSIPPSQMSARDEFKMGTTHEDQKLPSRPGGEKIGWGRERESTSITFLRCACVHTLLARLRTCCQRSTDSQSILAAAASSSRRIM